MPPLKDSAKRIGMGVYLYRGYKLIKNDDDKWNVMSPEGSILHSWPKLKSAKYYVDGYINRLNEFIY